MSDKPIKTILVDLDGVLSNCQEKLLRLFGLENDEVAYRQYDLGIYLGLPHDQFWKTVGDLCGKESLFAGLTPYKWANNMIKLCKMYSDEVLICSTVGPSSQGYYDKMEWIHQNLEDKDVPTILLSNRHKHLLANESTVLIDDYIKNVIDFSSAGGRTILFPAPYNRNYVHLEKPLSFVKQQLEEIANRKIEQ